MKLLQRYLLQQFIPVCFVALLFFVLLLELGDLFANLWKYLANEVSIKDIFMVMVLYAPKCVSNSMPMAVLFSSAYIMGNMYARNELTSIFASGYPLYKLIIPLLILGLFLSFMMFFFEDRIVITSLAKKNALTRILLNQDQSLSNTNIVVLSEDKTMIYLADYYQDNEQRLFSLMVIVRDQKGSLQTILQTASARWQTTQWVVDSPTLYIIEPGNTVRMQTDMIPLNLTEPPETFRRNTTSVEELSASDAKNYLAFVRRSGLPYAEELSNYYKRFSYPFTIFIVLFFSIALGGRFKKNVMLMSLLLSLSIAVLYYVLQMLTMLLSKWEYISPLAGAWFPVVLFIGGSLVIIRYART